MATRKSTVVSIGRQRKATKKKTARKRVFPKIMAPDISAMEPIDGDRERWLSRAAVLLRSMVLQAAAMEHCEVLNHIPPQISCSWPAGRSVKKLSQTVYADNKQPQISISPLIGDGMADYSVQACAHVLHELIHIAVGPECGHRDGFAKIAAAVGFARGYAEPKVSPPLRIQIEENVIGRLGLYPHVSVQPSPPSVPGARTQKSRQRKYVCANCGKIIRCAGEDLQAYHMCEDGTTNPFVLDT